MEKRLLDPEIVLAGRNRIRIGAATPPAPKLQPSFTVDIKPMSSAPTSPTLSDDGGESGSCLLRSATKEKLQPTLEQIRRVRVLMQQQQQQQLLQLQPLPEEAESPSLVLIGERQCGKTSLLAALCGLQLPLTAGTLCPVRLQLRHGDSWTATVSFGDSRGKSVTWEAQSRVDLQQAMRLAQERVAGPKAKISNCELRVTVMAPALPSFVCYDLPPIGNDGDRSTEIAHQILENNPNAVILLTLSLNTDPARWNAVKFVHHYDADGSRTVSALTFSDKVSQRTLEQRLAAAEQQLSFIRRGYVVVRLAPPSPTSSFSTGMSAGRERDLALAEEAAAMMRDPILSQMARQQLGCGAVAAAVADIALVRVKSSLPQLVSEISLSRDRVMQELQDLGPAPATDDRARVAIIARMFNDFAKCFQMEADGSSDSNYQLDRSRRQLSLHQRCRQHWQKLSLSMEKTACSLGDSGDQLRANISSFLNDERGRELPNFQSTFPMVESLIRARLLQPLKQLSVTCLREVALEVDVTLRSLADSSFAAYPHLCQYVKECAQSIKDKMVSMAKEDLDRQFDQESYVWASDTAFLRETQHRAALHRMCRSLRIRPAVAGYSFPNQFSALAVDWLAMQCCNEEGHSTESFRSWFLENFSAYFESHTELPSESSEDSISRQSSLEFGEREVKSLPNDESILEAAIEKSLDSLHAYIRLAVTRIMDKAPLSMMHYLLYKMSDELQNEVSVYQQGSDSLLQLLQERDGIGERRAEAKRRMRLLLEAEAELSKAAL